MNTTSETKGVITLNSVHISPVSLELQPDRKPRIKFCYSEKLDEHFDQLDGEFTGIGPVKFLGCVVVAMTSGVLREYIIEVQLLIKTKTVLLDNLNFRALIASSQELYRWLKINMISTSHMEDAEVIKIEKSIENSITVVNDSTEILFQHSSKLSTHISGKIAAQDIASIKFVNEQGLDLSEFLKQLESFRRLFTLLTGQI